MASSARFRAVTLFMARMTFRFPSKTTGSALTSSHSRSSFPSTERTASASTSWTGCPERNTDSKALRTEQPEQWAVVPHLPGPANGVDAAENVARLTVAACRQIPSDPSRERVVDPLDGAVLVDQEYADVGDVEERLKLRVGGLQLTGALLDQFLQVMPILSKFRFGLLAFGDVACRMSNHALHSAGLVV